MLALRQGVAGLLAALLLVPALHALPHQGGEDDCLHLLGYGGSAEKSTKRGTGPQTETRAAGICAVDNARLNTAFPLKTSSDFVPITGDDSLGFYVVYGVKASSTGGVGGNVDIFLFELDGGEVLLYGSGYGNIPGANLFDAAYDMERVDQVIRFCMGKDPASTPLRILAPHGHGDHINPACNRELERLGYRILEIAFHGGDIPLINNMAWTTADRSLFQVLPASTGCLSVLKTYSSPLGHLWVFERPGHTPGSIDLVIDVKNDVTNRFLVRGSQPSSPCQPLPGQREAVNAHGNAVLLATPPTLLDLTPIAGTSLGGTPITLTGANFLTDGAGTPTVLLNGAAASEVTVLDDFTIACKTPSGPPGQLVEVAVVNNNGETALPGTFFFNAQPTVTSLSPATGDWRGGTVVQVRGSGFSLSSGVNDVFFGAKKASSVSVKSDTLLTCRSPAGLPGAVVTVMLSNPNGQATLAAAFAYSTDLAISDLQPPSGSSLGGTDVVLTGSSFTGNGTPPAITFGGVPATTVTLLSDTSVSCVAPMGTPGTTVDVALTNSAGTATFSGFRYHALPSATTVTPTGGRYQGGTLVTLAGTGFLVDSPGVNQVRFGGIPALSVQVLSDGALTCLTPAGDPGSLVNVTLTNANGTATLPLSFTYSLPLTGHSLLPDSGTALGGQSVTIVGSGFLLGPAGATTVTFGGVAATAVTVVDDTTLTCLAPLGAPRALVDVVITNDNGSVTMPAAFRYHATPSVSTISPNNGHAGAFTPVAISGAGFLNDDAGFALVVVGGVAASDVLVVSDTQLVCAAPPGAPGTVADVLVVNQNGTGTLSGGFRYHTAPTLLSVVPGSSSASTSLRVTLTGTGFLNDSAGPPAITFGGVAATSVSVLGDQALRCNAPTGPAGQSVDIVLTNARGSATLVKGFRYHARPAVTAVNPNRGTFQGGTAVTLSGSGFSVDNPGQNLVTFAGVLATNVVLLSDSTLTCVTPPGAINAVVDVGIANANGGTALARGYSYSVQPPTLTSITPASGPAQTPGSVTLTGSGFVANSAGTNVVTFGGVASGIVGVIDDQTLSCAVPPGASGAIVDVVLTNANGSAQIVQGFRYHALPGLSALVPPDASALGGATIQLTGSGFLVDQAGTNLVTFGGLPGTGVSVLDDAHLSCVVPSGVPGSQVDVVVANANGQSGARSFSYHARPSLVAVQPESGPASGGARVSLVGGGFQSSGAGLDTVTIGGKTARNVNVLSDTLLECDTPRGSPGFVDVVLSNANGDAVLAAGYHYGKLPPAITSVVPGEGPAGGQNLVTIKGRGFQSGGAGPNRVKFGLVLSGTVFTLDDETVLCAAPAGTPGQTVDVSLNNNSGTVTLAQAYHYHAVPVLVAVSPTEGEPFGATRVTLIGSGFSADAPGETTVLFGSQRARNVVIVDDQHITCTPYGGLGVTLDVSVKNDNGMAMLPDAYRITGGPPTISSLLPEQGPFTGGTLVALHGSGFAASGLIITFGGAPASALLVVDDTHAQCVSPPGTQGTSVTVAVKTKYGVGALVGGYAYAALAPELTGLAPNHGPAEGGTHVTLSGKGFLAQGAGANSVLFGGNAASGVTALSDTTLVCDAPPGAAGTLVTVVVENTNGSATAPGGFRYHAQPTLSSLTPTRGPAQGGTTVTLHGSGFSADQAGENLVLFGGIAALDVIALDDSTLNCTTPPGGGSSTVDVMVANLNGAGVLPAAFQYHAQPALTAVTPARGAAVGGTPVTLTGSGFLADSPGPNAVTFGGAAALAVQTLSDTTITCQSPAGPPGAAVDVTVSNANGSSLAAGAFSYFTPPTLTSLTPARGPAAGGTAVTLTGSGFLAPDAGVNLVLFGGIAANDLLETSDTTITCTTPPGVAGTQVDVTLANENGLVTLSAAFLYHGVPTLSAVTPAHGPSGGNNVVTLSGSGFLRDAPGPNAITFGGTPATNVVVVDDATLTCKVPPGNAGTTVDVRLSNANGSASLSAAYRYHLEPTLTSLTPSRGPAAGGTSVTLTGTGFQIDDPGQTLVIFGGFAASSVVVVNDTTITCKTPDGYPNTQVNVTVANANGNGSRQGGWRYNPLPTLTSVAPASGPAQGGTTVTLTGSGFVNGTPGTNTVTFGGVPATSVNPLSDTTLTCVAPAGPGGTTVDVALSNANGAATLATAYRFNPLPTLSAIAPVHGPAAGGTSVTLTGSGFADAQAGGTFVTFGGVASFNAVVLDDTHLQCDVAPGTPGAVVDVSVVNENGVGTLAGAYRYHALPSLSAVTPARGSSAASSSVTLTGTGFLVDSAGTNAVLFGAVAATNVVVLSDTSLSCTVAPQAATSVVTITLTNQNGSASLNGAFAFDAPKPVLTALAPASGVTLGGTSVTLTGSGFQDFSAGTNTVSFGAAAATGVVVVSDTTITCQSPAGTLGTSVDVTVANANGNSKLPAAFTYVAPPPTLLTVTPNAGPAAGGGTVTLGGGGFQANAAGANAVTFGGVAAANVVVVSDASITCSVPAGPGGTSVTVAVTNANGATQLANGYRYIAAPTITSISPVDGTSLGGTLVTVRGSGFLNDAPGTNTIKFGATPATSVNVADDTRLTCRAPSGASGATVALSLTNANGAALLANAYRYHAKPVLTAVTPGDGSPLGGNRVTLSGSGFQADGAVVNVVTFGGITATSVSVLSDTSLQCNVPVGTSGLAVQVTVANVNGTALLPNGYRYHAKPTLSAVLPGSGPAAGGTSVALSGSGFQVDAPGTNAVSFGGAAAAGVAVANDGSLTCLTPPGTAGATVDVVLTNANGSATLFGGFTYDSVPAPIVLNLTPAKGSSQGSTPVVLTGSGFSVGSTVTFGPHFAGSLAVVDEHTITCVTPPSDAAGEPSLWVEVRVISPHGGASDPHAFQYVAPPTLRSVLPPVAEPQGGATVVLEGLGFLDNGAGENRVTFGGLEASAVSVSDDRHLSCLVPAGPALTDAEVVVANQNGVARLARGFRWQRQLATDLNRDGRGDLVVTASGRDAAASDSGAVHVFFGGVLPLLDRTTSDSDVRALPTVPGTAFGSPVASGDLDGDGIPELLVGAPLDDGAAADAGAVYVFAGPLAASSVPLVPEQARLVLRGAQPGERFGSALVVLDADRNGFLDLLVGAPGRDAGSVYLFLGGAQGFGAEPSATILGTQAGDGFATSLALGDLDGDGWCEIVVGAPDAAPGGHLRRSSGALERPGVVRVYRGGPEALAASEQRPWLTLSGEHAGERFGAALALRDLSGDGIADLIVGAPRCARAGTDSGAVFVFLGGSQLVDGGTAQAVLDAESGGDLLGSALAAGDIDGDGRADLLVGAPGHAGNGRAYVFRGGSSFTPRPAGAADARLESELGSGSEFGAQVALVDLDGDGLEDMIVSAPSFAADTSDQGRVYVFQGSNVLHGRTAGQDDGTLTGSQSGDKLGRATNGDH